MVLAMAIPFALFAQADAVPEEESEKTKLFNHYFSIQINELIKQTLNLSNAAALVLYEALRQLEFPGPV